MSEAEPLARVACPQCGEKFRAERAFDHFTLVETLGVGGMGAVYKARDTRLDRFVALKLLRKELSTNPAEAARLEQEARVTAAVNHPHVVQVYSSGTAHGQIYLVMELVNHGSLDDLMAQQGRVPERQVLEAGIQVARGLQAAHEKGLVHRDVKPANILFADARTAKIGDFGLAVAAGQQDRAPKEIWGTPYYVAPERLNNEPEDFRSDIYSLGATLFHALAGRPPMEGETTSAAELRQLKSHPPDLRRVAPDVSRETARIVNRMLVPNPAHRFATYGHLVDQLTRASRALPSDDGKSAALGKPKRWMIAAAALGAAVIAGGAFYYLRGPKATDPPTATATAAPAATPDPALAKRFEAARAQLIDGKYDPAAAALAKLSTEAKGQQPLLNWVRLHRGLAALLQGKTTPAREAFQEVERSGNFSDAQKDAALAQFFTDTARVLAAAGPARASVTADLDLNGAQAFAAFLYGIKNWQLGEFNEAAPLFERFQAAAPAGELAWINDYKPLAQKFLADHRLYSEWKKEPQRFNSPAELRAAIGKLRELEGKLQTRSALADAVKEEARKLTAHVAEREKAEKAARDAETKKLVEQESPILAAALEAARKKSAVYDFVGSLAIIDGAAVTQASLKEAKAAERKKTEWLAKWKTQLISDLQRVGVAGAITDLLGTTYTGAAGATESRIVLRSQYGTAELEWTKLSPATLLALSTSFFRGAEGAALADRQWLSAAFAHATGQQDRARELADEAAKGKPQYRDDRALLGLPR
ncbi:MAG: serine/threonine protein kinase [Verrucomicrobiota bacterium]|nr:serine/threonine protein kinase [Verrucomicrobiota bacterium]